MPARITPRKAEGRTSFYAEKSAQSFYALLGSKHIVDSGCGHPPCPLHVSGSSMTRILQLEAPAGSRLCISRWICRIRVGPAKRMPRRARLRVRSLGLARCRPDACRRESALPHAPKTGTYVGRPCGPPCLPFPCRWHVAVKQSALGIQSRPCPGSPTEPARVAHPSPPPDKLTRSCRPGVLQTAAPRLRSLREGRSAMVARIVINCARLTARIAGRAD